MANDGSIEISLTGDAKELEKEIDKSSDKIEKKIQSVLNDTEKSAKSKAASIASIYKKLGDSQSDALKKAWQRVEKDSSDTNKHIKQNVSDTEKASTQSAQKVSSEGEKTGSKVKDAVDKITTSVSTANSKTNVLKKSLELLGSAGKTAYNGLKTTGEVAMKSIATAATASVSVMGGVATAAVNVGKSFEAGMSTVASVSGVTGVELEKLRAKAKEMGATTAFSATQATDAMNYMAMAGWKTNEMISGIDGIMNLAAASGADLATTSDIVTDALTAFGMTAKDSAEFADVMAAASSNANTNVELMGATFKYVGAAAGAMGYSIQDIAVATGLMANAGIKGEMAGTALRSTITRLAKPTKESQEAMDALGVSLTDSKGKMKSFGEIMTDMRKGMSKMTEDEKASYAAMLGGQEAMSGLLAIANASDADFAKLTKAIEGSTGAAEKMAKVKLDNLEGDITILKSGLEGFGIQIYEEMQKPLRNAAQQATDMVSDLSKAFSKDGFEGVITEGGKIISNLLTIVAQKSPKIIDVGFSFVDSIIKGIQQNSNKLTGTALLIVDKIADGIKNTSTNLMPLVGDFANVFVQGVLKYKDVFWSVAFDMVTAIAQGLSDHADEISAGIVTLINNIVAKMDESLPVFIETASNLLINVFETLADNMPDIADNLFKMVSNIGETLLESLPTLFDAFSNLIISVFEKLAENMPDIADDIAKMIAKICELLSKNLPKIIDAAGDFLEAFINELLGHADEIFDSISGIISSLFNSFTKLTPKVKTIVTLMAALYAAKGVANVLKAIDNTQIKIQGLFGLIKAHPLGLLITAAVAALGFLQQIIDSKPTKWDEALANYREENAKLESEKNALKEKLDDASQAYDDYKTARDNAVDDTTDEWNYYGTLWDKLQGIVDQNGKVIEGQDAVAKGICEKLTEATGIKFEFKDGMIEHYEEISEKIEDVLIKQKALALQSGLEDSYITATTSVKEAASNYTEASRNYENKKSQVEKLLTELESKQKAYKEAQEYYNKNQYTDDQAGDKQWKALEKYKTVRTALAEAIGVSEGDIPHISTKKDSIENWKKIVEDSGYLNDWKNQLQSAEEKYFGFLQDINEYETLETAISEGSYDNLQKVVNDISNHLIKAEYGTKEQLENQLTEAKQNLKNYREGLSKGLAGITEDTVANQKDFLDQSKAELAKFNLNSVKGEFKSAKGMSADELAELRKKASSSLTELKTLYDEKSPYVTQSMIDEVTRMIGGIDTQLKAGNAKAENNGKNLPSDYASGISSNKEQAIAAADNVKTASENALKSSNAKSIGRGFINDYLEGINEKLKSGDIAAASKLIADMSITTMQEALENHSPTLSSSVILAAQQATRATAQRAASSVTTTNIHNITNNAYQQSQQTSGEKYVQESIISFERGVNDLVDFLAPKIETRTRRVGRKAVAKLG